MPRVPTLTEQSVVSRGGSNGTLLSAPAAPDIAGRQTQQLGQALERAGAVGATLATQAIDHANRVRTDEALNDAARERLRLTVDPEEGFASLRGRAALERPNGLSLEAEYGEKFRQRIAGIASGLGNDAQRAAFQQDANRMLLDFESRVAAHRSGQYDNYQLSVHQGTVEVATQQAVLNWGDTGAVSESASAIRAAVTAAGKLQGKAAQDIDGDVIEAMSAVHVGVVSSAIDNNQIDYARQYLKDNKASMSPAVATRLREQLQVGDIKDKSLRIALRLSGDLDAQTNRLDRMFEAGEISAEVRDATVQRVTARWNQDKALDAERTKSTLGAAQDWVINNPGATIIDLPANLYEGLKANAQLATISSFINQGGKFVNDAGTWASVIGMSQDELSALTPTDFYNQYRGKLDDRHLEKGYALIAAAKGEAINDPKASGLLSAPERTKRAAKGAKLSDKQAEVFENEIDRRILRFEQTELGGKRTASETEIQQIVDRALLDKVWVEDGGYFFFDAERPLAIVGDDELPDAYVMVGKRKVPLNEIPTDWQVEIQRRLIANGETVTQQAIAEAWLKAGAPKE